MDIATEQLVRLDSFTQLGTIRQNPAWPVVTVQDLMRTQPDAHFQVFDDNGTATGRCSLWWTDTPPYKDERVGLIGHYAAQDEHSSTLLLDNALKIFGEQKCTIAIGPMDGNTWEPYRFITDSLDEPPFLLEPQNPPEWPRYFMAHGFWPLAHYHSSVCDTLDEAAEIAAGYEEQLQHLHHYVDIRTLDADHPEQDLLAVYALSVESFKENFMYRPITADAFLQQCHKFLPLVDPRLFLLAEEAGELVGFAFCVPNALHKVPGKTPDTVILKSLADSPHSRHSGLGSLLMGRVHLNAAQHGYRRVIHTLMHDGSGSAHMSENFHAQRFRGYTLFARQLA